jgi:hypothetical protein
VRNYQSDEQFLQTMLNEQGYLVVHRAEPAVTGDVIKGLVDPATGRVRVKQKVVIIAEATVGEWRNQHLRFLGSEPPALSLTGLFYKAIAE